MLATLRQRRYLGLFAIAVVVAALCSLAGTWQIARFGEKKTANNDYRANNRAAVQPIADVLGPAQTTSELQLLRQSAAQRDAHKYRRVSTTGIYLANQQSLLRGQTVDGDVGYVVLTPLVTESGVLLIARGFITQDNAADTSPRSVPSPPLGSVTVLSRLQAPDTGGDRFGQLPGIQVDTVNLVDQSRRLGKPLWDAYGELLPNQPGQTGLKAIPPPDMSNPAGGAEEAQHAAYVFQWYCFAVLALAAPFILAAAERRRDEEEAGSAGARGVSLDDQLAGRA